MSSGNSEIKNDMKHISTTHVSEREVTVEKISAERGVDDKTDIAMEMIEKSISDEVNISEAIREILTGNENAVDCDKSKVAKMDTELEEPLSVSLSENGAIENGASAVQQEVKTELIDTINKKTIQESQSRVIVTNKSSASLNNLLVYETSSEEDSDDDCFDVDDEIDGVSIASRKKVIRVDSSSSSSCGSIELLNGLESSSSFSDEEELRMSTPSKIGTVKKTENKFGDYIGREPLLIPDISKLSINVEPKDLVQVGKISAMVDEFVMVDAIPGTPPYNLDTFMFLENGTFLGAVFDVMGPVSSPIYVLRFKSATDPINLKLNEGMNIFIAPRSEHTKYVFLRDLMSVKGSDASWVGDVEVPEEFEDFSDDEKESKRKAGLKANSRKRNSLERHKHFEHKMNKKNTMDTVCQLAKHQSGPSHTPQNYQYLPPPLAVPVFDPRTPPPPMQNFTPFPPHQISPQCPPNFTGFQSNWGYGHPQPPGF